jgi:hypothetical protein
VEYGAVSQMTVTELRRVGASVLEETPVKFIWTSETHSMMQDTLDLELQVNTSREMPAGADEPVEHIQSVEWMPVEMHGEWKDQWAGQGFAERTYTEFARMCGRVPLVRVEIETHSLVGIITKFKLKWRTKFEIGYGFTLSVHHNETIGSFRSIPVEQQSVSNFAQHVRNQQDSVDKINTTLDRAKSLPLSTEDVTDALDNIDDLSGAVGNARFAANAVAFDNPGDQTFLQMLDSTQHKLLALSAAFAGIRTQASRNLADVQELVSTDVLAYHDVVATLHFEDWVRTQQTECNLMIGSSRAAEKDARILASRKPRGIHRVRQGDTLDRVSEKWYGTPDSGRFIRDANNLDSVLLPVGRDLLIPEVSK